MDNPDQTAPSGAQLATGDQWIRFVSGLVEELRLSLSELSTIAALVAGDAPGAAGVPDARFTASLSRRTQEVQALVEDVSEFVRLIRGGTKVRVQPVSLADLVSRLKTDLRSVDWQSGVAIDLFADERLPETLGTDPELLVRATVHLVEAAAGVAENNVTVRITSQNGDLVVQVEPDSHKAVEHMKAALDPFGSWPRQRGRNPGGPTLALPLSQWLARCLEGELAFDGQDGAEVIELRIPLRT